jgi:CubicO group peptidase (beta-lactamase class C family)
VPNSPEFRDVVDAVTTAISELRIPGAALGILADGREEHAAIGLSSLSSLRPVTDNTLFQIASITKTFTATAIWRLIGRGALDLDAPVRRYLPGLRLQDETTAATVTVANLLSHTAGWYGDQVFDDSDGDDALARYVDQRLPQQPQLFACGELFSYSNSAFQLLGRLIEVATGTTFHQAMGRLVFAPLGLDDTLLDRKAVLERPYADGHTAMPVNGRDAVLVQTPVWLPRCVDPAGGIWSTTRDVLRYARAHFDDPALAIMQEPVVDVPGLDLRMGRSWFVQDSGGLRAISHNGDTSGQHSVLVLVPEHRFAFVVLLNGQPGAVAALTTLDEALSRYPGLAPLSGKVGLMRALLAPSPTTPPPGPLSADQLDPYVGRYVDPGQTTTFRLVGDPPGGLETEVELTPAPGSWEPAFASPPKPPSAVTFQAPDLAVADGVRIPFVRNANSEIGWMGDGLRLRPRS